MYVRWNKVKGRLCAVLVESKRVNGQPRQKVIGYLASILDAQCIIEQPQYRYNFWVSLREHLDNLQRYGEIDADTRQSVEDRIARTVRRATSEDVEKERAEFERECEEDERELEREQLKRDWGVEV